MALPTAEILERFSRVYNGAVSDMLDQLGYRNQVLPKELTSLTPNTSFCGTAFTVLGEGTHSTDTDVAFRSTFKNAGRCPTK